MEITKTVTFVSCPKLFHWLDIAELNGDSLTLLFFSDNCIILGAPLQTWGGFLIRRSSAIRRFFPGFLRCDNRTIMKSFLKKIVHEFSGNFVGFLCKFSVNSRAIFLRSDFMIVRLSHFRNPAINLRIAELRLMRNPPLVNQSINQSVNLMR